MNNSINNNQKKVSVIIPCYNAEKTIIHTLQSLENQTCRSFEAVIINDGSKDNTDKVINNYLKKCSFEYKYIRQENAGVSVARNVGLEITNSKYIMFLDADDVYHPKCIELVLESIENNNANTVCFSYSRNIETVMSGKIEQNTKQESMDFLCMMETFMFRKGQCAFFTYIYIRSIIEKFKIKFTVDSRYGEDLEFTWKYLSHCTSCIRYDMQLYGYYNNPNSAVNNVSWTITEALESVKRVEDYFEKQNNDFKKRFKDYMYSRTMWSIVKDFAIFKRKNLYEKIINEYDVSKEMKKLVFSKNILIRISAVIFNTSPKLFYLLFQFPIFSR